MLSIAGDVHYNIALEEFSVNEIVKREVENLDQ